MFYSHHAIPKREKIKDSGIFPETPAKIGLAPQGTITKPYIINISQMLTNVNDMQHKCRLLEELFLFSSQNYDYSLYFYMLFPKQNV